MDRTVSVIAAAYDRAGFFAYGVVSNAAKLGGAVLVTATMSQAQTVTIAALGDSLTAGYGLAQQDGFVPQMQDWLDAQGADVTLINAGVSGDTTAGGLNRVGWTLTPEVDAMIVALGGNDYLRGIDPAISAANLSGILAEGQAADLPMLLVGLEVGNNYGTAYKTDFEAIYSQLSAEYEIPLFADFAAGIRAQAEDQAGMRRFLQEDGIHPNADGVALIVAAMGPAVLDLANRARTEP